MFRVPCILFAISFHESAHALVSSWLGDTTARDAGRVSLNPLRHLNPVGMLMMLFFGIGWASPVMINPSRFKHPKAGMAVPPLDGSRVLLFFLPERIYFKIMQYERYIMVIFIALIVSDVINLPISYVSNAVIDLFLKFAFLPFGG